jgi:hypothetical protein
MKRIILAIGAACAIGAAFWAGPAAGRQQPPRLPQRVAAEEWVAYIDVGNLRAACELQTEAQAKGTGAVGEPCGSLPTSTPPPRCPKYSAGAKLPYRKSEIRTVAEQVGEFTEESPTRGFVRINAQVKASGAWGAVGLEQVAGVWRITYFRYADVVVAPAGNVYETWPFYHQLWVSNQCPTDHPRWEQKK